MRLDEGDFVRGQYRSTERLETRVSVWQPDADGRWPQDVALAALAEPRRERLLDVGCGTGAFAARCAAELGCGVVALDSSPEMVGAAKAHGVEAVVGDAQRLPFADGAFDGAVAAWMLYHVPDVGLAIAELARVLCPGGRLVAITNGRDHLAELWQMVGAEGFQSSFSRESGGALLGTSFELVERRDVQTRAVFADRASAAAYLATLDRRELAARLPEFGWPLVARGCADGVRRRSSAASQLIRCALPGP